MAAARCLREFSDQTCSICKQCFDNPVTIDCGHNFCEACLPLLPHWGEPNRDPSCLLCSETVHQRNFKPNQQLANLAQLVRKLQEGAKRDAERREVSKSHQDPPWLFCKEDQAPIHTGSECNKEENTHDVVPVEVAPQGSKVTQAASPNINATKTPVLGSPTTNDEQETMCSICKEYLIDPVTLDCGHNFCRGCITNYCKIWEIQDGGPLECPLCKFQIQKWNFRPNLQLAETVENLKLLPLKLYKERIQTQLKSWEKEKQILVDRKQSEEEEKQKCLKQLNAEKGKIKDTFEQMQNSLKLKESSLLACLRNLEKEIKKKVAENGNRLTEDISHLTNLIAEVQEKCEQPPLLFLQDIESTLLRYEEKRAEHSADLYTWLEERLKICSQKNSALVNDMVKCADSMEEVLKKAPLEETLEKVSVTLDPQTAHPLLTLSADLKSVKVGEVPDDEDMDGLHCIPYVLGREKFTSGRHWWEVELGLNAEDEEYMDQECLWIVGAAQESFQRNRGFDLSPKARIWAVGVSPFSKKLTAFTSCGPTHLCLAHEVRRIRVSLDYKACQVEFFDADTNASVFTFSAASFTGEVIRPFFCLGGEGLELKCGN
ncbi:tripartite motif-containing protein 10-like [Lacerta agilis]|uniref:tripartite motif-containing protein 10-like n=1 Tax=Lacerta agilis TaxID=80427 RepID=UPI00141A344E|nr:tripartite motif-containing protein 10-like [Lacerta agilis]